MMPQDVRYLAFDGAGAKSAVFLGAVRAIEHLGLLPSAAARPDGIAGFSGSSTGAVPAALLACGIPAAEASGFLSTFLTDLLQPDERDPHSRPAIRIGSAGDLAFSCDPVAYVHIHSALVRLALRRGPGLLTPLTWLLPGHHPGESFRHWMADRMGFDASLADALLGDVPHSVLSLYLGGGVATGRRLRNHIDHLLAVSARTVSGVSMENLTFRQHHELFRTELRLSATNLSSGKSLYLSRVTTPDLPIADAIRLCVSVPLVVKPVYLTAQAAMKAGASEDYAGLWIDGGALNLPAAEAFCGPSDNGQTIALRFAIDTDTASEPLDTQPIARFLPRALLEVMAVSGHRMGPETGSVRVITLEANGLRSRSLDPDETMLRTAQDRAYEHVLHDLGSHGQVESDSALAASVADEQVTTNGEDGTFIGGAG